MDRVKSEKPENECETKLQAGTDPGGWNLGGSGHVMDFGKVNVAGVGEGNFDYCTTCRWAVGARRWQCLLGSVGG